MGFWKPLRARCASEPRMEGRKVFFSEEKVTAPLLPPSFGEGRGGGSHAPAQRQYEESASLLKKRSKRRNCSGAFGQDIHPGPIAAIGKLKSKKGNHEGTKNRKKCTKVLLLPDSFVFFVSSWLNFFLGLRPNWVVTKRLLFLRCSHDRVHDAYLAAGTEIKVFLLLFLQKKKTLSAEFRCEARTPTLALPTGGRGPGHHSGLH